MKAVIKRVLIGMLMAVMVLNMPYGILPDTGVITAEAASAKPALNKKSISLYKGKTYTLTLKNLKAGNKVKWSSSKKSVATVKSKGASCIVTGKKAGSATIYAKVGKKTYKCKVSVKNPPVALSAKSKTIYINKSFTLALNNTKSSVKWSTSNKKVAAIKKVSKYKYQVTGKKAGSATVTAKVGKKSYKCKVVVKKAPPAPAKPVQTPTQPKPSQPQTEAPAKPNPPQTEKPAETEPPQTEKPAETEPPQTEKPAETEPPQTEKPAETEPPQTEKPAETEPPQTEKPAETEPPQTEKPAETEPPVTQPKLILRDEYKHIVSKTGSGIDLVVLTDLPMNSLSVTSSCNDMNVFCVVGLDPTPAQTGYFVQCYGVRKGTYTVSISGGGETVTSTITIENDNTEFLGYASWCNQLLNQLGCSKSDPIESFKKVGMWIVDNTDYSADNGDYTKLYILKRGDCEASTGLFVDIAKRVYGLNAYSTNTGVGHTKAAIIINGEKWVFDAGGVGVAGQRGFSYGNGVKGGIYSHSNGGDGWDYIE